MWALKALKYFQTVTRNAEKHKKQTAQFFQLCMPLKPISPKTSLPPRLTLLQDKSRRRGRKSQGSGFAVIDDLNLSAVFLSRTDATSDFWETGGLVRVHWTLVPGKQRTPVSVPFFKPYNEGTMKAAVVLDATPPPQIGPTCCKNEQFWKVLQHMRLGNMRIWASNRFCFI